jgi:hypothetical protein
LDVLRSYTLLVSSMLLHLLFLLQVLFSLHSQATYHCLSQLGSVRFTLYARTFCLFLCTYCPPSLERKFSHFVSESRQTCPSALPRIRLLMPKHRFPLLQKRGLSLLKILQTKRQVIQRLLRRHPLPDMRILGYPKSAIIPKPIHKKTHPSTQPSSPT